MIDISYTTKEFEKLVSMIELATAKTIGMGITRSISEEHMGVLLKVEQAKRRMGYSEGYISYFIRHLTSERK